VQNEGSSSTALQRGKKAASVIHVSYGLAYSIPGLKDMKRYPNAEIKSGTWTQEQYNDRFRFVSGEMQKAVNLDPDLRDRAGSIIYIHEMVGTSPDEAKPCIIVFCKKDDFQRLRSLFNRVKKQLYCGKKPLRYRLFWGHRHSDAPVPPFELIYYQTNYSIKRSMRRAAETGAMAHPAIRPTWCGDIVRSNMRTATLGLTVQVGSIYGVTTVDHLFQSENQRAESVISPNHMQLDAHSDSDGSTLDDNDLEDMGELWVDTDLEYLDDDDDYIHDDESHVPNEGQQSMDKDRQILGIVPDWERISPPHQLPDWEAYQDWSLARPTRHPLIPLPNLFFPYGTEKDPVRLEQLAQAPRFHRVPVYIVSGVRGLVSGRLLATSAMIGSGPGRNLCEAWTVILDSEKGNTHNPCSSNHIQSR
jgi:hypothetical protein